VTPPYNNDAGDRFVGAGTHADAAVVVVTYNSASDISQLIDDLRVAAQDRTLRVIVVDNQSSDGTTEIVRAHADVKLVESGGNLGYAGGINVALPFTEPCDAVLILNPDLRLKSRTRSTGCSKRSSRTAASVQWYRESLTWTK
jgi:GT2 family glycosyltransferase